jgi:Domain of unknown function (DUF222)/HNH endonuclease
LFAVMATLLAMSDPARLDLEELESELATLAAHLYAGMCRWLELLGELDRRGGWAEEEGTDSCAAWVAWRCGLTPRAAREHVRVARRLPELPHTRAAFAQGEVSYAKVRALTRVATADSEEELLELARVLTAAQLERTVRVHRRMTTAEAHEQLEQTFLSVFWNPDGSLELHGRLAPEDGALLLRALEARRDSLWREGGGSAEPRPARQASNAEALVAVCDASLAHVGEGRPGGERYQIVVHADEQVLSDDGDGGCELEDGSPLAPETARRLGCDAAVVRNGHRSRTIPASLRRALRRRDQGCRFPGCENRRFLDGHHVEHWAKGGATTLGNLLLLCRRHHRLLHEGGYTVDDEGRFYSPWGAQIEPAPRLPRGDPGQLVASNSDLNIDDRTHHPGGGESFDLDYAVHALVTIKRRAARSRGDPV